MGFYLPKVAYYGGYLPAKRAEHGSRSGDAGNSPQPARFKDKPRADDTNG
jgi:hypothetical protein